MIGYGLVPGLKSGVITFALKEVWVLTTGLVGEEHKPETIGIAMDRPRIEVESPKCVGLAWWADL
jgi:hypothetical protein